MTSPAEGHPKQKATSVTTWNRIEPRVRSDTWNSLEARLYDPLWLLARQWQVGEFAAEDAGSPIVVSLSGATGQLDYLALAGSRPGTPYSPAEAPLEAMIEAEPAVSTTSIDLRLSARAGLWWWSELDAQGLGSFRQQYLSLYPLKPPQAPYDGASARTASLLAGRVCDGLAIATDLAQSLASNLLPAEPAFSTAQQPAAIAAAQAFLARVSAPGAQTASAAWNPARFEYDAAAAGTVNEQERAFVTSQYRGGTLDWYAFDIDPAGGVVPPGTLPSGTDSELTAAPFPRYFQPQPARFAGMPRARFWEFEDGNVNFGAVETGPTDLTRLLLIEYALVFGNDYFVVPLSIPLATICELAEVLVTDTFGGVWSIPTVETVDGADGAFKLFTHAPVDGSAGAPQLLLVPPTAGSARSGQPLERLRLVRDEPAEMAWGIEEIVQGQAGRPVRRVELQRELDQIRLEHQPAASGADVTDLRYSLLTPPPAWWVPLVPKQSTGTTTDFALQVRALPDPNVAGAALEPLGRILSPGTLIADEEVPRSGVEVHRVARRTRWIGGRTAAWVGRRVRPGRVEGSSGLSWDVVDPTP